ncbi:DUF4381 family protein [Aeromonas taiwanensis]|uniref:DUF4381 family protein n=1 Tax=Aeromonas taiwanensis TaxID=633417 RepID=UPI00248D5CE4|nr:DUF4381 family protein [Aeromonas taiwanensis]
MLEKGFSVPALLDPSLPERVSWWPLAFGWRWLGALLLLALCVMALSRLARWRRNRWRREAGAMMATLKDVDGWLAMIKRIRLVHHPRAEVARAISPAEILAGVPVDEASRHLLCERYCRPDSQLTPAQNARLARQITAWLESLPHV